MKIHLQKSGLLFFFLPYVYLNFFFLFLFCFDEFLPLAEINFLMLKIGLEEWTSTRLERNDRKSSHCKLWNVPLKKLSEIYYL